MIIYGDDPEGRLKIFGRSFYTAGTTQKKIDGIYDQLRAISDRLDRAIRISAFAVLLSLAAIIVAVLR